MSTFIFSTKAIDDKDLYTALEHMAQVSPLARRLAFVNWAFASNPKDINNKNKIFFI